jgi:fructuronate reductase
VSERLALARLAKLGAAVERPRIAPQALAEGVVHLGLGAFARAHLAAYLEEIAARGDWRWGVVGVSLRSPSVRDTLAPQDGLYTLVERDAAGTRARIMAPLVRVLVAPEDPAAVVAAMAQPSVRVVTLTVTEKGYCLDRKHGGLDKADPGVGADLTSLGQPRTAVGFLVAALNARRDAGLPPFTTISCDNLPDNGTLLREAVLALASAPRSRPCRVDRRVRGISLLDGRPHRPGDHRRTRSSPWPRCTAIATRHSSRPSGSRSGCCRTAFAGERPDFARAGVTLADDVAPWEEAKLRLLNGAHSMIAYLGGLGGIAHVHEFVASAERRALIDRLWDESAETLDPDAGIDVAGYREALLARFANPALRHRTLQIAMDGSQKLPQRLVAPWRARLERGLASPTIELAVAAWMAWQRGADMQDRRFVVDDPLAETTAMAVGDRTGRRQRRRAICSPCPRCSAISPSAGRPPSRASRPGSGRSSKRATSTSCCPSRWAPSRCREAPWPGAARRRGAGDRRAGPGRATATAPAGTARQLVVAGKPFLIIGGELSNSAASSEAFMASHWARLRAMHLNTVLAPVSWELVEPEEGRFDWSVLDSMLRAARANDLKLVLLWFGAWKNSMSTYAPSWVKRDQARFPRAALPDGRGVDILSPFGAATLPADQPRLRRADGAPEAGRRRGQHRPHGPGRERDRHAAGGARLQPTGQCRVRRAGAARAGRLPRRAQGRPRAGHAANVARSRRAHLGLVGRAVRRRRRGGGSVHRVALRPFRGPARAGGQAEYPLPMYLNVALQPPRPAARRVPERRAAAAPARRVEGGRAGARSGRARHLFRELRRDRRHLPPARQPAVRSRGHNADNPVVPANAVYAIGAHDALGFAPFSIDSVDGIRGCWPAPTACSTSSRRSSSRRRAPAG